MGVYNVIANFNATDNITAVASKIGDKLGGLAGTAVGLIGEAIAVGFEQMEEVNEAMAGLQARTGKTADELEGLKEQAKGLQNTGLVEGFNEAALAAEAFGNELGDVEMSAEQSAEFLREAAGMAKAWDASTADVINTVGDLRDKFADLKDASPAHTLDLMTVAAQQGHMSMDDLGKVAGTFGSQLSNAGLTGTEALALISTAADNGMTNFAAITKTVQTFHERLAKPPSGFKNTLYEMGLNKVAEDLKSNKITMGTALESIYAKLDAMPDGPKKTNAQMMLFGKNIEKLDPAALQEFTKAFENIEGAASNVADVMEDDGTLGAALRKAGHNVKTFLGNVMEDTFQRIKSIDWKTVGDSINAIVDKIKETWNDWFGAGGKVPTMVNDAFEAAKNFVTTAQTNISGAVSNVVEAVRGVWDGFWSTLSSAVDTALNSVRTTAESLQAGIAQAFSAIATAVTSALQPIIDFIDGILAKIREIGGGVSGLPTPGMPAGMPIQAAGGPVPEGWSSVGEQGSELVYKSGASVTVFSNTKSSRMVASAPTGGGGGGVKISISAGHVVGSGGMQEFVRMLYTKFQSEQIRRSGKNSSTL